MSNKQRWEFFKDSDTSFGVFYPEHYTLAAFRDRDSADSAAKAAIEAGFDIEDVRAVDGQFLADTLESQRNAGFFDRLKAEIADAVGTETSYIELDQEYAERGAAFVFIYSPEDGDRERVEKVLRASGAIYARTYRPLVIESLIDEPPSEY